MGLTTVIDWFALVLALLVIIKLVVISFRPKTWMDKVARPVWSNSSLTKTISLILAIVVLYYLLQTLTIVQIFAVALFFSLISASTMASFSKEILSLGDRMIKGNVLKGNWFLILVWLALSVWVLVQIFS